MLIATPTASADTLENPDFPGIFAQHVIGVGTGFAVSAVVKSDKCRANSRVTRKY
ncbi:MAG: hypothetical protein WCJ66_05570 [Verrucomicrobiota bacterium]